MRRRRCFFGIVEELTIKILFIYTLDDVPSTDTPIRTWDMMQLGISYIAGVLKAKGHIVRLLVLGSNMPERVNRKMLQHDLVSFDPRLVCFTSVASQYSLVRKLTEYFKDEGNSKYTIIGGVHASLNPDSVILDSFDALCVGEGEYPVLELVEQLEKGGQPSHIPNLWIKKDDGSIERNATRPFIDPEGLPFPERDMWRRWVRDSGQDRGVVLLGRGCPFKCSYCSNHALRKLSAGRYVRLRSPAAVVHEIELLKKDNLSMSSVYLEAETIGINREWLYELCSALREFNKTLQRPLSFGANYRVSHGAAEDCFPALRDAGFAFINLGLESGSERVRHEVLGREYSNEDFINTVRKARNSGLKVNIFNLIGVPGETMAEYWETVQVNRECQPDQHMTSIFFPYPGTDLYSVCKARNLLPQRIDTILERKRAALDLPGFSRRQIETAFMLFNYRVYKGHKPRWELLLNIIRAELWRTSWVANLLRYMKARTRFRVFLLLACSGEIISLWPVIV